LGVQLFSLIRKVLSAVKLDHQPRCVADEISDVFFDRDLASETNAIQAMIP